MLLCVEWIMAKIVENFLPSVVYDYLSKVDTNLAEVFKKKTKAVRNEMNVVSKSY